MFPIDLNTATYFEMVQIPRVGPITAKKILKTRENFKIKCSADLERVVGANLTRKISPYVDLKDKRLTDFLKRKVNKDNL
jgi:competence protein ComEA